MARQEIPSTFGDGLMMDLNPINTPKSVLTDCLNGTYITYNGNEFVLQNDMGNYKLKNCKLPTNFIPVGVKGYADILYIVSYNPITKETEIGSYPAPQSIFTTSNEENKVPSTDEELAPFNWPTEENQSDTRQYPELIKNDKKPLFIFAGSDEETYKLNPGDEFKLEGLNDIIGLEYIYQHLNFYVIDEDNKLYDLDDSDMYFYNGEKWSGDTMRKVFWETPGWLAAQYDLYVPDKFNLNLKSLNVPEFLIINDGETSEQAEGEIDPKIQFEASMDLSSQVIITDLLFQNELNKWKVGNHYKDLYIRYKIETTSGKFHGFTTDSDITVVDNGDGSYDIPCKWHNYQDDVITAFVNCSPVWWMDNPKDKDNPQNYDGVIAVTAYPIIKYNGKILEFTQFETKLRFPLNTLKNSSGITIADQIYKWSVDSDSCTISFNINGPFINANDITGKYEIYRINLFKNPPGSEENPWDPDTAISNLDNPESYSKWTGLSKIINAKVEGILEKSEGKDEEEFIERAINADIDDTNPNDFINQKKVLMCKGTLPNLVLYGQNTININWDSSNEYKLTGYQNWYTNPDHTEEDGNKNWFVEDTSYVGYEDTTKTIDFNKEGGIYIFRVILEKKKKKLAESKQVLIPSEVFNEWFGSIDNYNNVYENQWIENYRKFLNISAIELYNAKVNIYKSNINREYNEIAKLNNKSLPTDYKQYIDEFKTFSDISSLNHLSKSPYSQSWPLYIDYLKLIESIEVNKNISSKTLKGNLWNNNIDFIYILKQSGKEICQLVNIANNKYACISYLDQEDQKILYQSNSIKTKEITSQQLFPTTSITNYVSISSDLTATNTTNKRNRHFSQWNYRNLLTTSETPLGGGVWTEKNGVTWPSSSYFGDPLACFGTNRHINVVRFRIKNLAHVNKGWSCALCYGNGGAGLNTSKIINYGEQSSNDWYNNGNSRFLVFRAANKATNTDYNGICIVDFGTNSSQHTAVINILPKLYLNTSGDIIDAYAVKISNIINLNNKDAYTINKLDLRTIINFLRVDDVFLSYNTKLYNLNLNTSINSNLVKVYLNDFNNILEQYNLSINSLLLEFNWINNEDYNNVYLHFNSQLDKYNKETVRQIEASSKELQPITLKGDDPTGISQSVINKLTGQNGEKITIDNVAWNNGTGQYLIMYNSRDGHSGTNPTDNTGRTFEAFIEEFVA